MEIWMTINSSRMADYSRLSFLGELHARFNPPYMAGGARPPNREWKQHALALLSSEEWGGEKAGCTVL